MSKENAPIKKIFDEAFQHYQNGNLKEAETLFKKVLESIPKHFSSTFLLGTISSQIKQYQAAIELLKQAIEINPNYAEAHNNLGNVFQELDKHQEAISYYQKAININADFAVAYHSLGNSFQILGKQQEAIACYQKAIKINPNYAEAYHKLGKFFRKLDKNQEAIACYQKAIKINPNYAESHNNLGNVFLKIEKYQEAIASYQKAIKSNANFAAAYYNLGNVFQYLSKHQEAIKYFQQAIQKEPGNLSFQWLSMNTLPIIYSNFKEIEVYEKKFEDGINKINQLLDKKLRYTKKQIIDALTSSTNYYLHYQGKNVLTVQKKYSQLVERLTKLIYPQFHKKRKKNSVSKYIKIGFVSAFFRSHSVSKTHKNWILKLDQKYFKRFVYYADNKLDQTTNLIKENTDHFFSHTDIDQLITQISNDNLDILIYLDIGMSPRIQILSSLRLAPIQCLAMGHPVTSGFKNIDYALSCELMEPHNAQNHYTEKLIKLPNTGQCYEEPNFNKNKTKILSKKYNNIIFLNLQSLFKLLPQDDHIYLDILKKYPNCCFWFLQGERISITAIFKERMSKLFQNYNLSFNEYFVFHPRCSHNEFLGLIEQSDIILDSINWSGNNSTHEAISLDKPIVTLPSSLMRGRHTYSILKILDIEETIASSKEEYVKIAVKLAKDKSFKESIRKKIQKNKNRLFNDDQPIRFLETFFKNIKQDV